MQKIINALAAETGASWPTIRKWLTDPSLVSRVHDYALSKAIEVLALSSDLEDVRTALKANG